MGRFSDSYARKLAAYRKRQAAKIARGHSCISRPKCTPRVHAVTVPLTKGQVALASLEDEVLVRQHHWYARMESKLMCENMHYSQVRAAPDPARIWA
jgi:hypothetical protein